MAVESAEIACGVDLAAWEREAHAARQAGDLARAAELWDRIVKADAAPAQAWYEYGDLLRQANRRQEAVQAFKHAADAAPDNPQFLFDHGQMAREFRRLDEATQALERARALRPEHAPTYLNLGLVELARGDNEQALRHFERAALIDPASPAALLHAGDILRERGWRRAAERVYFRALEIAPNDGRACLGLGLLYRADDKREEAQIWLDRAAEQRPAAVAAAFERAQNLRELRRFEAAIAAYEALLERDAEHGAAAFGLALSLKASGAGARAVAAFERAAAAGYESHAALREASRLSMSLGQPGPAAAFARRLIEVGTASPADADWLVETAIRAQTGDGLAEIARTSPDGAVRLAAAKVYLQRGEIETALTLGSEIWASGERSAEAARLVRHCLMSTGREREAVAVLEAAVEAFPEDAELNWAFAQAAVRQGRFEAAEAHFTAPAVAAREAAEPWEGRGFVARAQERHEAAAENFAKAAEIAPKRFGAFVEWSQSLLDLENEAGAAAVLSSFAANNPDHPEVALVESRRAARAGQFDAAIAGFEGVIARDPEAVGPRVELAKVYEQAGRIADMQAALGQAEALAPDAPSVCEARAHVETMRGAFEAAAAAIERALSVAPLEARFWTRRAQLQAARGFRVQALATLARADEQLNPSEALHSGAIELLRRLGRRAEAVARSRTARAAFPRSVALWRLGAQLEIETGARTRVDDGGFSSRPARAAAACLAGEIALATFDIDKARERFAAALRLSADDGPARRGQALASLLSFDIEAAATGLDAWARVAAPENALRGRPNRASQTHFGQILDEFRLEPKALEDVRATMRARPEARLAGMAKICRAYPDATAPAMALTIELRRQGKLALHVPGKPGAVRKIPHVLAQYWDDAIVPEDVADIAQSWRRLHPDFVYRRFDFDAAQAFLAAHGASAALEALGVARDPARRADLFRLAFLHFEGGVYVDMDDYALNPIGGLVSGGREFVAFQEDFGGIGNNFLAAKPNHPIIAEAFSAAVESILRGDNEMVWLSTGPGLVTRAAARAFAARVAVGPPPGVAIFDRAVMLGFLANNCIAQYKFSGKYWINALSAQRKAADLR